MTRTKPPESRGRNRHVVNDSSKKDPGLFIIGIGGLILVVYSLAVAIYMPVLFPTAVLSGLLGVMLFLCGLFANL